jgi:cytochrome d ubiquinol oxidase subunit II
VSGAVVGGLSVLGVVVVALDAPALFDGMIAFPALGLLILAGVSGFASMFLLWWRQYLAVRLTAALAVTSVLWAWGLGQFPYLLPGVTAADAASTDAVLIASLTALGIGAVLLIPSLWLLYATFQREHHAEVHAGTAEPSLHH